GYALALFIELMASSLIGAPKSVDVKDHPSQQGGFLAAAVNPEIFGDRGQFLMRVEETIKAVKSVKPISGVEEVLLPGELEERIYKERLAKGVPLDEGIVKRLRELGALLRVPFPEPLA
ncbi:MAG: Ldh family oxidoreductase, partial [Nitrososphaerota archaeon]